MTVLEIRRGPEPEQILTFLNEGEIARLGGVPPQAVIGVLMDSGDLQINATFREFLHEAIGAIAPLDPDMTEAARQHPGGRFVYVDGRSPAEVEPVPAEDILGWFRVHGGEVVPGSYSPNPEHRIQSERGLPAAIEAMRQAMVDELIIRSAK